jgi:hypothetical protein
MEPCAKCGAPINLKRDGFARDPEKGLLCLDCCWEPQQSEHTPLPWVAEPEEASAGRGIAICAPGHGIVATITPDHEGYVDAVDWANAWLIVRAVNNHENLVAAYDQVEKAFLDALDALNDAGLPCPASLELALEKLRQVIAHARQEENDALPG